MPAPAPLDQIDAAPRIMGAQCRKRGSQVARLPHVELQFARRQRLFRHEQHRLHRAKEIILFLDHNRRPAVVSGTAARRNMGSKIPSCWISSRPCRASSSAATKLLASADRAIGPSCPLGRKASSAVQSSEEHTSELQSLMRISYAVFCLKKKKRTHDEHTIPIH